METKRLILRTGDKFILVTALFLLVLLYSYYWRTAAFGNQAMVSVGGKFWSSFDLYQNQDIEVPGKLGISVLRIEDGKIRFIASPCTTKQCIHQGWLHDGGEFAACLPNQVSVQIPSPDPRFDSMNF